MSAVPYVAPWRARLERFSTQILTPVVPQSPPHTAFQVTAGATVWWRLVYLRVSIQTVATVGNRTVQLFVQWAEGTQLAVGDVFRLGAPLVQPALVTCDYLFAPRVTTYSTLNAAGKPVQQVVRIPEVRWPPRVVIGATIQGVLGNDRLLANPRVAIEVAAIDTGQLGRAGAR